ncbi:hypothetical protein L5515_009408 [Caenorhabditis briggsae]|uniref:SPK domain-containing protein n=1 Tax=Caenorhabditis briggsae TaxID=6238 RepID=A0AAE9FBJ8_CAEBR|nr:hypothetical protein L5515_009408 [Caenorhabditis briggsae]
MSTACLDLQFVIRYISDRIGNYDKPECLFQWCKEVLREKRTHKMFYAGLMSIRVSQKLNRVETLEGFSLMEKLQLVFIFSRPVSDEFVQMLKEAKFQIEQDGDNKISRFSTEDGSVVRSSDHHPSVKYFKGVLCLNTPLQNPASEVPQIKEKPKSIRAKLEETDAEIKREPIDKKMAQEKEQKDVENDIPSPAVRKIKEEPIENVPIEPKQEEKGAKVKEEPIGNITMKQEPKQEVDEFMAIGRDFRQTAFNGRINYDELDEQEFLHPGFPQNSKPDTARPQKRRQSSTKVSAKLVKTEHVEEDATSSDTISTSFNQKLVKVEKAEKTPTSSAKTSVQLSNRKCHISTIPKKSVAASSDSIDMSGNQKLVNAEVSVETSSNSSSTLDASSLVETTKNASPQPPPPEVKSTAMAPDEPKISVMSIGTHIETIAEYYELESLKEKASRGIEKMKCSGEDKTLPVKKFCFLIVGLLICIEENLIRQTETSISLKSILKHLQLYLIRPLGSEETLELISQKLLEFKNSADGVPPNLLSECLTNLLISTGFYDQLN